jgi:hypothetical protein
MQKYGHSCTHLYLDSYKDFKASPFLPTNIPSYEDRHSNHIAELEKAVVTVQASVRDHRMSALDLNETRKFW